MTPSPTTPEAPSSLLINELQKLPLSEILRMAVESGLRLRPDLTRRQLILDQIRYQLARGGTATGTAL